MTATPRVIVVGAGAAGLAAAWRLATAGADVTVLERGARAGGRLAGEVRDGFTSEPGAQVLSSSDRSLCRLLEGAGLEDELLVLRSGGVGLVEAGFVHELHGSSPGELLRRPGVGLRAALRSMRLGRLVRRFGANLDPAYPERAAPHDDRSLADFARLYFGAGALQGWIGPETTGDCLGDEEETSRVLFLLRFVARRGARPALFRSGAGGFVAKLAGLLDVRTGTEVVQVDADTPGGALVHFREDEVEGTAGADAVVVATPAPVAAELARDVLTPAERDFHAGVTYEPAITLEVTLSDPVSSRPLRVRVPHSEGWPIASLALEPGRQGGRVPDGCAVARLVARSDWSRAHLDAPDDAIAKELCRPLQRLFPVTTERTRDVRVARWPLALPRFEVGRYRALARLRRVEADRAAAGRRVWFAGDHLVAPSVEGAVTSGLRAADAAISRLGL